VVQKPDAIGLGGFPNVDDPTLVVHSGADPYIETTLSCRCAVENERLGTSDEPEWTFKGHVDVHLSPRQEVR
jgi:hypothetical protein